MTLMKTKLDLTRTVQTQNGRINIGHFDFSGHFEQLILANYSHEATMWLDLRRLSLQFIARDTESHLQAFGIRMASENT